MDDGDGTFGYSGAALGEMQFDSASVEGMLGASDQTSLFERTRQL
jgi:hypothetical protein